MLLSLVLLVVHTQAEVFSVSRHCVAKLFLLLIDGNEGFLWFLRLARAFNYCFDLFSVEAAQLRKAPKLVVDLHVDQSAVEASNIGDTLSSRFLSQLLLHFIIV